MRKKLTRKREKKLLCVTKFASFKSCCFVSNILFVSMSNFVKTSWAEAEYLNSYLRSLGSLGEEVTWCL